MTAIAANQTETFTCTKCGEAKARDQFYTVRGRRQQHCKACEIRRSVETHRAAVVNETRTFGVELEFLSPASAAQVAAKLTAAGVETHDEHYNHHTRTWWKIVPDGSIRHYDPQTGMYGMELVSPPLSGKAGTKQLKAVLRVLNRLGCKVTRECGVHVHHDARDLDFHAWKSLAKAWVRYESTIDQLHPVSRRANNNAYCRSNVRLGWNAQTVDEVVTLIDMCIRGDQVRKLWGTRYTKLNCTSFVKHGTVEFRQHAGSLNYEKIINWVALTQGMVEAGKAHREATTEASLGNLMRHASAKTSVRRFFAARAAALAA